MNIDREIKRKNNFENETISPLLDIVTLDNYCKYIISNNKNIRVSGLNLVKDLFDRINPKDYGSDIERLNRIEFIKRGLEARLKKKLTDRDLIIQYINGGPLDKNLLDTSNFEEISDETLAYLNEQSAELVKSYFVDDRYNQILSLATDLRSGNYSRRSDVVDKIKTLTSEMNMRFNKIEEAKNASPMFTLIPGEFETSLSDIYARETSPTRMLKSGMVGLNMMLAGGFQSGRVYMLFANAAGGKSFTMLDLAMQIKNHNKNYIPHDPTKIPTIIFLTMENSQEENVSRMMNMISNKTFNDYSLDESFEVLRGNGLGYSENDPIDICMIYKPNLSVNTDYLYTLVDKMHEMGREPICIFQDHIKRIRAVNSHKDMRLDLGEIVNEFKAFANAVGIPVITDSHLNREAAKKLDEGALKNKKDLLRVLGSSNVSESFLMIDNCDVGIIINKELDSHDNLYMGFAQIKTRTKCDLEHFYQPYVQDNPIKLVEDIDLVVPAFRRTLIDEDFNGMRRVLRKNDYTGNLRHQRLDDDDDLFSINVFGDDDEFSEAAPQNNILLPDNANQSSFIITGEPSQSYIPISNFNDETINNSQSFFNQNGNGIKVLTEQEQRLINLKYTTNAKTCISYFDENGMVTNDGVEDLI